MLKTRLLTAAVLLPIVLGLFIFGPAWFVVAFIMLCAISGFAAGASDLKTIYDVVLLCTFIALGSTVGRMPLRVLNWMLALSAAVAVFEYFAPAIYTQLVDPLVWVGVAWAVIYTPPNSNFPRSRST